METETEMETEEAANRRGRAVGYFGREMVWRSFGFGNAPTGKKKGIHLIDLKGRKEFSRIAIDNLRKRLLGAEERITVYLSVRSLSNLYNVYKGWLTFNGNKKEVSASYHTLENLKSTLPPRLRDLTCYGCAVLDSSIIVIAGGMCRGDPSNDVFIYHTVSKTWKSHLPLMNVKRGQRPTVVGADGKVFVFGGGDNLYQTVVTLGESWGEFYDFSQPSKSWAILPTWSPSISSPSGSPALVPKIISHAVYENKILLWLSPGFVLYFNYCDGSWNRYDKPMSIAAGPQWSAAVVVLENFLFWHNYGTIYAHDLLSDVTIPMYTLPRTGFSSAIFSGRDDDVYPPKFLVHIGRGKLCLFYQVNYHIRYITFLVQISHNVGPPILCLVVGHSGFLQIPSDTVVHHALEITS